MTNKIEAEFTGPTINIGIKGKDRKIVTKGLSKLLSDTYLLYLKTQGYHWNVTGKLFKSLHSMFEEQYKEIASSIDEIAERIRALGEFTPASFSTFMKLSSLKEENAIPAAEEMIHNLVQGNEAVVLSAREIIEIANECEDDVTADLMVERMRVHEKNAWMLRSMLTSQERIQ